MPNYWYIFGLTGMVIALIIVVAWVADEGARPSDAKTAAPPTRANAGSQARVQTNTEGSVTVSVELVRIPNTSAEEWLFDVILNTHNVELDMDISETFARIDDSGAQFPISRWEGDPPGGHHREVTLAFVGFDTPPARIAIVARNVGDISERLFSWNLPADYLRGEK
jgi:hypothetical protein